METRIKKKYVLRKEIKHLINKILSGLIIFLIGMIIIKNNSSLKEYIRKNVYEQSISFINNRKSYEKYLGSLVSINDKSSTTRVSSNKISYIKKENIDNGVKLSLNDKEAIPLIESGVVVFLGEKDNLSNVMIVEQVDGIETLYSGINFNNIKLYDYLEKNEIIGESINKEIFLCFKKNGEYIDYQKYI